jgi:hypothetical protein
VTSKGRTDVSDWFGVYISAVRGGRDMWWSGGVVPPVNAANTLLERSGRQVVRESAAEVVKRQGRENKESREWAWRRG